MNSTTTIPNFISTQIQSALTRISSLPSFQRRQQVCTISPLNFLVLTDDNGYAPLHYAAASSDITLAKQLVFIFKFLGRPEYLTPLDKQGRTPLHWAVESGTASIVHLLTENGAALNTQDYDGASPLHRLLMAINKNTYSYKLPYYRDIRVFGPQSGC
jgi:ankyrin repeat protein